jgi:hypothetical protein
LVGGIAEHPANVNPIKTSALYKHPTIHCKNQLERSTDPNQKRKNFETNAYTCKKCGKLLFTKPREGKWLSHSFLPLRRAIIDDDKNLNKANI